MCWEEGKGQKAASLKKGDHVQLTGALTSREYQDKDGIKRRVWKVRVKDLLKIAEFEVDENAAEGGEPNAARKIFASLRPNGQCRHAREQEHPNCHHSSSRTTVPKTYPSGPKDWRDDAGQHTLLFKASSGTQ